MKTSDSTFRSRFLAYRRATMLGVAIASISAARTIQQDDDRDAARRATTLLAERLPAMDDSMREVDRIESPVSQLEHGADVEAQGWGGSTMLTRQERTKLAIDVDAMRAKVALAKGAQWLVVL